MRRCDPRHWKRQPTHTRVCRKACRPEVLLLTLFSLVADLHTAGSRPCSALLSIPTGMAGGTCEGPLRRGVTEGGEELQCTSIGQLLSVAILETNGCTAIALDSRSRQPPSRCRVVTRGLVPDVFLTTVSCDLRSLSFWRLVPLGTSTVWRAVLSCSVGWQVWSQTHTALHHASASPLYRPAAGPPIYCRKARTPDTSSVPVCLPVLLYLVNTYLIQPRGADGCSPGPQVRTFPSI